MKYGIFVIIISAGISATVSFIIPFIFSTVTEGPACRIDVQAPNNEFSVNKSTEFVLPFNLVNLRNEKVLFHGAESYCVWIKPMVIVNETALPPEGISSGGISVPEPLGTPSKEPIVNELDSFFVSLNCRSPNIEGNFDITINALTSAGSCSKTLKMVVR